VRTHWQQAARRKKCGGGGLVRGGEAQSALLLFMVRTKVMVLVVGVIGDVKRLLDIPFEHWFYLYF
jgi:hypothetical protein